MRSQFEYGTLLRPRILPNIMYKHAGSHPRLDGRRTLTYSCRCRMSTLIATIRPIIIEEGSAISETSLARAGSVQEEPSLRWTYYHHVQSLCAQATDDHSSVQACLGVFLAPINCWVIGVFCPGLAERLGNGSPTRISYLISNFFTPGHCANENGHIMPLLTS